MRKPDIHPGGVWGRWDGRTTFSLWCQSPSGNKEVSWRGCRAGPGPRLGPVPGPGPGRELGLVLVGGKAALFCRLSGPHHYPGSKVALGAGRQEGAVHRQEGFTLRVRVAVGYVLGCTTRYLSEKKTGHGCQKKILYKSGLDYSGDKCFRVD